MAKNGMLSWRSLSRVAVTDQYEISGYSISPLLGVGTESTEHTDRQCPSQMMRWTCPEGLRATSNKKSYSTVRIDSSKLSRGTYLDTTSIFPISLFSDQGSERSLQQKERYVVIFFFGI